MTDRHDTTGQRLRRWLATTIVATFVVAGSLGGVSAASADDTVVDEGTTVSVEPTAEPTVEPTVEPTTEPVTETATPVEPAATEPATPAEESAPAQVEEASIEGEGSPSAARVAAIEHVGTAHTTTDGAVYYIADSLEPGAAIRLSGSGWKNTAGTEGSVIAVRLAAASGFVSTKLDIAHPVTGAVQANKTIYAIAQADAEGEWEIEIPFPTTDNASQAWAAGDARAITLLTGSLLTGDVVRNGTANVTVAGGVTTAPAIVTDLPATASGDLRSAGSSSGLEPGFAARIEAAGVSDNATVRWYRKYGNAAESAAFTAITPSSTGFGFRVDTTVENGSLASGISYYLTDDSYSASRYNALNNMRWYAVVSWTDAEGAAQSLTSATTLWSALLQPPTIASQPADTTVRQGATATFTVADADGFGAAYTWQVSTDGATWSDVAGGTAATLSVSTTGVEGTRLYRAVVTNTGGSATSSSATLTVTPSDVAPTVRTSPQDIEVSALSTNTRFVATSDDVATSAQWQVRARGGAWTDIPGATSLSFSGSTASSSYIAYFETAPPVDGTAYRVVFANGAGSATSDAATLTVREAVVTIAEDTVERGGTVHLSATGLPEDQPVVITFFDSVSKSTPLQIPAGSRTSAAGTLTDLPVEIPIAAAGDTGIPRDGILPLGDVRLTVTAGTLAFASDPVEVVATPGATAPVITAQPVEKTFAIGEQYTYSVSIAENDGPVYVRWGWKVNTSSQEVASSGVGTRDGDTFRYTSDLAGGLGSANNGQAAVVYIYTKGGIVTSDVVSIRVAAAAAPAVTTQPNSQIAAPGGEATFTAAGTGVSTPDVQWQKRAPLDDEYSDIAGATSTSLTVAVTASDNGTVYRAVFTNQAGSARSNAALLTVTTDATSPSITTQPQAASVEAGATATFTAAATGAPTPSVQWWSQTGSAAWAVVAGATAPTLTIANTTTAQDGTLYKAVFTNAAGTAETEPATLTVTAPATTRTYTVTDGAGREVTYTVPTVVEPGEDIVVSGTNWRVQDGSKGSVFSVLIDATFSGDPNTLYTKREVTNPVTAAVSTDKRLHAIVEADASGNWAATIPFPTAENSSAGDTTPAWSAASIHQIRFLSGTLETRTPDVTRSLNANFTIAAKNTETYTVTDGAGREVTYTVPTVVEPGEDIVVSGTNWRVQDGSKGSVFSVLIDATFSGDPNTLYTKREVTNPVTAAVSTDKRLHAIVEADASGNWAATIPFPTAENSSAGDTTPAWSAASIHQIRFLSGTLETRTPDVTRSLNANFTIAGEAQTGPTDPPTWAHESVSFTSATGAIATAWVEKSVDAGDDSSIRIKGTGWTNQAGTGASTVAIKLNRGEGQQYTRSGSGIVQHPSATGDDTIWVLLAPSNPQNHPNVIVIDADGNFEIELDAPDGLAAGQYLSVLFQSGRFDAADVLRTVTTGYLTVGGVPYTGGGTSEEVTCVPTSSAPTLTIENPEVGLGGKLHVTGTGWCHPGENRGGSSIAFKLDEGAYSHLTADLHQNLTIWAVATANAADGTLDFEIQLPDGTTSGAFGSSPAFTQGAHTLRLLTGSLKSGDLVRTLLSTEFVVGDYQPNGAPDPLEISSLTTAAAGGVTVAKSATALTVKVPGAVEGDWIFLTPYATDGSPRYPWLGTWFRADANGEVIAPLAGATLPVGRIKIAVQSGNQGELGALRGWDWLTVDAPVTPGDGTGGTGGTGGTAATGGGTIAVPSSTATGASRPVYTLANRSAAQQATAPSSIPEAPFAEDSGLTAENVGGVTGVQDGTIVTITLADSEPGDWVYLYAYSTPIPVGWIQVDENRQVRVDVAALDAGMHKIAVLAEDGSLIGWTSATVTAAESQSSEQTDEDGQAAADDTEIAQAAAVVGSGPSAADWWLLGGGGALVLIAIAIAAAVAIRRRSTLAQTGESDE